MIFSEKNGGFIITSEIQADLKEFVKYALQYFHGYNIPELKCELLGHHLENLRSALHQLGETPLNGEIYWRIIQCSNPGMKQPSVELTREQKHRWIDINDTIMNELRDFPRLYLFLEITFDDSFEQIRKTLKLVIDRPIDDFEWNVTVDHYMKELALLRHERKGQPLISKCIEEIRQELETYDCLRSASQPIDEFIAKIKQGLD